MKEEIINAVIKKRGKWATNLLVIAYCFFECFTYFSFNSFYLNGNII